MNRSPFGGWSNVFHQLYFAINLEEIFFKDEGRKREECNIMGVGRTDIKEKSQTKDVMVYARGINHE